jgi:hypothetical protein
MCDEVDDARVCLRVWYVIYVWIHVTCTHTHTHTHTHTYTRTRTHQMHIPPSVLCLFFFFFSFFWLSCGVALDNLARRSCGVSFCTVELSCTKASKLGTWAFCHSTVPCFGPRGLTPKLPSVFFKKKDVFIYKEERTRPASCAAVSICTLVLVRQLNWGLSRWIHLASAVFKHSGFPVSVAKESKSKRGGGTRAVRISTLVFVRLL